MIRSEAKLGNRIESDSRNWNPGIRLSGILSVLICGNICLRDESC